MLNIYLQFVADGVFYAELNKFFEQELAEDGYTGCEVRPTPTRTEIIIRATRTKTVLGEKGQRIRELTAGTPRPVALFVPFFSFYNSLLYFENSSIFLAMAISSDSFALLLLLSGILISLFFMTILPDHVD